MAKGEASGSQTGTSSAAILSDEVAEFLGFDAGPGAELHAVVPLSSCPHLSQVNPVPAAGITTNAPCAACGNVGENWTCLSCYQVGCGRYVAEHAVEHGTEAGHPMALSFADLSVWCYSCDAYVHHPDLVPAKSAGHQAKFGVPMPH